MKRSTSPQIDIAERLAAMLSFEGAPPLDPDGFRVAGRAAIKTGRRIGQAGWTFPMYSTLREVADLVREAKTEDIDTVFVRYYDAGGRAAQKVDQSPLGK